MACRNKSVRRNKSRANRNKSRANRNKSRANRNRSRHLRGGNPAPVSQSSFLLPNGVGFPVQTEQFLNMHRYQHGGAALTTDSTTIPVDARAAGVQVLNDDNAYIAGMKDPMAGGRRRRHRASRKTRKASKKSKKSKKSRKASKKSKKSRPSRRRSQRGGDEPASVNANSMLGPEPTTNPQFKDFTSY